MVRDSGDRLMDIMIDNETLNTKATSVILTMGLCAFKPFDGIVAQTKGQHYTSFDIQDQINKGRTISGASLKWWMGQSEEARNAAFADGIDLKSGLQRITDFVKSLEPNANKVIMWARGQDFDIGQLNDMYETMGMVPPWKFWNSRDTRTLYSAAVAKNGNEFELEREGTYHNALDDAIYQAHEMCWVYKELGLTPDKPTKPLTERKE